MEGKESNLGKVFRRVLERRHAKAFRCELLLLLNFFHLIEMILQVRMTVRKEGKAKRLKDQEGGREWMRGSREWRTM